jgi:hypothetical protein
MRRSIDGLPAGVARTTAHRAPGGTRSPRRALATLALVVTSVAATACEGDNLFSGETPELLPRVLGVNAPETAIAGDTIGVRVDAYAARGVAQILVSLDGTVSRDTVVDVLPPRAQVTQTIKVPVPALLLGDTLLTVRASITDVLGNVSRSRETQVVAFGPPVVQSLSAPQTVRAGDVINLETKLAAARRITRVDYQVRGAFSKDTSIVVGPPNKTVSQVLTLQVPTVVQDTVLRVSVSARDESGFTSTPKLLEVPLSIDPPVLEIETPAMARAGGRMEIDVTATGLRKVSQIKVELRGAHVADILVAADPQRSEFQRTIAVDLPGTITSPMLDVHVYAIDTGGAISARKSEVVEINLEPPVVLDVEVPSTVFNNQMLDVRVKAQSSRPFARVDVRFRGAVDADKSWSPGAMQPPCSGNDLSYCITWDGGSVLVPDEPKDVVMVIHATVTDVTGEVSEIVSRVVVVEITEDEDSTASASTAPRKATNASVASTVTKLNDALGARARTGPAAVATPREKPALVTRKNAPRN